MTRPNNRWEILTALWLLFALRALAQGTEPTLVNTMNSMANALNSRGTISWTETFPGLLGISYTITSNLKEVNADSSACSLRWTSVYTSSDDKLVEAVLVRLEMLSGVRVQPYSEYLQSQTENKFEVSPAIYIVEMKADAPLERHRNLYHKNKLKSDTKPPSALVARIVFTDEQTANKVADGIRQAAKSCKASKSSP